MKTILTFLILIIFNCCCTKDLIETNSYEENNKNFIIKYVVEIEGRANIEYFVNGVKRLTTENTVFIDSTLYYGDSFKITVKLYDMYHPCPMRISVYKDGKFIHGRGGNVLRREYELIGKIY